RLHRGTRPAEGRAYAGSPGRRRAERTGCVFRIVARGARAPRDALQRDRHIRFLGRGARAFHRGTAGRRLRCARPAGCGKIRCRHRRRAPGPRKDRAGPGGLAMIAPPFLIGAALAFWGWQTGHLVVGIALGIALEAPRYFKLRLELGTVEHSRIADLSTIGFVTLAALLAANRGVSHGILAAFTWVPAALAPIMLAQLLSETGRIPLSALFRYMRKLRRRNPEIKDPPVDGSLIFVALAMIAAGVANARGPEYYVGVVIASAWALHAVRPSHSNLAAWLLMLAAAAGAGHAGQLGLAQLQAQLESWAIDFNMRGLDADPYRSVTEIGTIGRLKQSDAILLRVYAAESDVARVKLLHRSSYNSYFGTSWLARESAMQTIESEADNTTWNLAPEAQSADQPAAWGVRIVARIDNGKALLPLPASTTRVTGLPALSMRRNSLGTVHVDAGADWLQYRAEG